MPISVRSPRLPSPSPFPSLVPRPARMPAARRAARAAAVGALVLLSHCAPAHAQVHAQLGGLAPASVVLPWGDALVSATQWLAAVLFPILVAAGAAFAARVAGPLRFLVTTTLVERLVRNATDYALNAVAGAVRGRTLTVPVGSAVIARAVERALEQSPAWLVRAAGGRAGIAQKVFRSLELEDAATPANTLRPALRGGGKPSA